MGRVSNGQAFTPAQVSAVVKALGLPVRQETVHDYLILCPFHNNNNTPSMSVSKYTGDFICFNPGCGKRGSMMTLIKSVAELNDFEALRFIINHAPASHGNLEKEVAHELKDVDEFAPFPESLVQSLHEALPGSPGMEYMLGRGFRPATLDDFNVGYSVKQEMVTVPVYAHNDILVGQVGRSIEGKHFKNSTKLPGSRVVFNLNNAKRLSPTVIIVESIFDAMRVHQAGHPNVVATLGGYMSPFKMQLINRYFDKVIIMTDADEPGRKLGRQIADNFSREVLWAMNSYDIIYPDNAKDAGDMTDEQISQVINNAITDIELSILN